MIESRKIVPLVACLIGTVFSGFSSLTFGQVAVSQFALTSRAASYVPDEVLVTFKSGATAQMRSQAISSLGDRSMSGPLGSRGFVRVKLAPGHTIADAMASYRALANVESVQPNYIYHAQAAPNDAQYGQLWAFKNIGQTVATGTYAPTTGTPGDDINVEPAWGHITDCSTSVVAVVDSGVNYNQEDLALNMWNGNPTYPNHGWDYVDNDNDPMDLKGHGTHVAGIIGATGNNSTGTTGVCWKASIMAVRVLNSQGLGTTANIIQGIDFAVTNAAKVINMSLGGISTFDPLFSNAISAAQSADVIVVVAAGNGGPDGIGDDNDASGNTVYPCNFTQPNLICVAALDQNFALAIFSNWGTTSVDVGAPGTNIRSTWAGTENTITDTFNSSGVLNWTTSGGWGYAQLTLLGIPVDVLVNPITFPSGTYSNSADNRVYKSFNLSGNNVATLSFFTQIAVQANDFFNLGYSTSGGDPFAGGGILLDSTGGVAFNTGGVIGPLPYDLSPCISATCTVGFQLVTDASGVDQGAGVSGFSIHTLQLNTNTYNTIDGTSMATPETAGVATMLRAFNPQFTYADVINAIENGGRIVAALAGRTTTGKAVDAMGALEYINPPTGVAAAVVP